MEIKNMRGGHQNKKWIKQLENQNNYANPDLWSTTHFNHNSRSGSTMMLIQLEINKQAPGRPSTTSGEKKQLAMNNYSQASVQMDQKQN